MRIHEVTDRSQASRKSAKDQWGSQFHNISRTNDNMIMELSMLKIDVSFVIMLEFWWTKATIDGVMNLHFSCLYAYCNSSRESSMCIRIAVLASSGLHYFNTSVYRCNNWLRIDFHVSLYAVVQLQYSYYATKMI